MGIRTIRGRPYYYRSVRQDGRVRSIFVAAGDQAVALAEHIARERSDRDETRRAVEAERRESEATTGVLVEWSRGVEAAVRGALESAGFHRHKRGEWRRRKVTTNGIQPTEPSPAPARAKKPPAPVTPEVLAIERRWLDGDATITKGEAKALLDARPEMPDTSGATPSGQLLAALLRPLEGDKVRHELTRRKFHRVRRDLEGAEPTAMERLLAERAALCWLDLQIIHMAAARLEGPDKSFGSLLYLQKRVDAAHRRFLSAVKALAVVRKLKVPDLKVNIDGRSVHFNTAAPPPAEGPAPSIDVTPGPR